MTHEQRVIVIGCGIGGPVAAIALHRAGFEPVVYEAHAGDAAHVGSFLNLASNGLSALRTLGVAGPVLAEGFSTPRMVLWSGTGKRLGVVPNGEMLADGTTSITIKRGLVHRALREEVVRLGIPIEHGKRFLRAELGGDEPGSARAWFDDGSSAAADVIIGADGVHSRLRRELDPGAPEPRFTGQLSIGGVARPLRAPADPGAYHMIFGKRAFFGYAVSPSREVYWFANVSAERAPGRDGLSMPAERLQERLYELFAGDAGPALELIAATVGGIGVYPIFDLPRVPVWHRGRVALVGDAIHATSPSAGQGAALAIEDALVLAKCLRDVPGIEAAFAAYERARRGRVERVVRYANRVGSTKIAGPIGRWLRDWLMPSALKLLGTSSSQAWLYRHRIDWDRVA